MNMRTLLPIWNLLGILLVIGIFLVGPPILAFTKPSYDFSLEPAISQFLVTQDFTNVTDEFSFKNGADPVYYSIDTTLPEPLRATIYAVHDGTYQALTQGGVYLAMPESKQSFTIEIMPSPNTILGEKEYLVDVSMRIRPISRGIDIPKQIQINPILHRYILVGITKDAQIPVDPTIAVFSVQEGPIVMLNPSPHIVSTIQNRGVYTFAVKGTMKLLGPFGFERVYTIPPTYILAGSQKDVLTPIDREPMVRIPQEQLSSGQYSAILDLSLIGNNTPRLYSRISFWMVSPWILSGVVLLCFIMIATIVIISHRHT